MKKDLSLEVDYWPCTYVEELTADDSYCWCSIGGDRHAVSKIAVPAVVLMVLMVLMLMMALMVLMVMMVLMVLMVKHCSGRCAFDTSAPWRCCYHEVISHLLVTKCIQLGLFKI